MEVPGALDKILDRAERHGPWILLLIYYFVWLNNQLNQIIELLDQNRHLLEIIAGLRK